MPIRSPSSYDISYQTSSEVSSLPDQKSSSASSTKSHKANDVFAKTEAKNAERRHKEQRMGGLQRLDVHFHRKKERHPILPAGMTRKTLQDDKLFDEWFR